MADLPSILGGMAQGFLDFGKSAVDLFGTGGASIADLIESARTGKVTTKNSDDFRKWLYDTNDVKDAAAKGLGTALNGVQTVSDYIPGIGAVTRNPLFNAGQGAIGGLADEFKMYGKDYDLGRAGQRAAVGAGGALASTGLADALKGSGNALLKSGTAQGLARGAVGGAIGAGGYTAIDGGSLGDVANSALQGAGMGAALGGTMGALQDFKPARTYDVGLTDDERASRLKEVRKMRNAIGPEKALYDGTLDDASASRWSELWNLEQAYKNGFDNYEDYHNTLRPTKGIDDETLGQVLKNMKEPELQPWMQKGSHQPTFDPTMSSLASSMDRTVSGDSFMPDDFYQHMDWYGGGDTKPYLESASAIQKIRGNPNAKVTMYRATVGDTIYPNDWVTLSPEYAKQHLANALRDQPDAKIIKQTVAARDLRWPGDDINEFGYYPITNGDIARAKAANGAPKTIETTLADADMAVNNPKLTPEQEAYFKDSVMRDSDGNLMPVYHSSPNKFTEFDDARLGNNTSYDNTAFGHFVTNDRDFSSRFKDIDNKGADGYTMELYADVKNPITHPYQASGKYQGADLDNIVKRYYEATDNPDALAAVKDWADESGQSLYEAYMDMTVDENPFEAAAAERDLLRNKGYDAVEFVEGLKNELVDGSTDKTPISSYAVFGGNQLKDVNNLSPTDNPDIRYSKAAPDELDLGRVLSGQDLSINNAKAAPGQLGLFDDMPTQTPKTGTRQTSLFDQPQEGLDHYGEDIVAPSASGPVDRSIEDLTKIAIDESTLPKGWKKAQELASMGKKAKQIVLDPNDPNRAQNEYNVALYSDAQYGRNMPVADVVDKLGQMQYGREVDRGAARLLADQLDESGDEFAKKFVTGAAEAGGNIAHYRDAPKAKLADEQLSNLLNIGRSSSMLSDSLANPSARNARGDQWKGTINLDGKNIAKGSDGGISTLGHERLHAFQDAGNMGYDQRVVDAYNELHDDLSKIYHSESQIRKDYGNDVKYWSKPIEQEARMAQFYLEDKFGIKGAHRVPERDASGKTIRYKDDGTIADPNNLLEYYAGKPAYRGEFEGDRKAINAAFDKFRGKLQDLTRKGVALPALTALFGGGALMANQQKDKEEVR